MANHKFHGTWTYYVMADPGFFPEERGTLDLHITDATTGTIEPGSKLEQKPVTGSAGTDTLNFEHPLSTGFKRTHTGRLFLETTDLNGKSKQMMIVGRFEKAVGKLKRGEKPKATLDQDQGTWIITKP